MLNYFSERGDPRLYNCGCDYHNCAATVSPVLPVILDLIREDAGVPMTITSGPRCVSYNIDIGGSEYSEHIDGEGADVECYSSRARMLIVAAAIKNGITRIGVAKTFIHLGISTTNDQLVMWVY